MRRCNSHRVVRLNPLPVPSAGHRTHPLFMLQIPPHRFANSTLKCFLWLPSQFALNLGRIHRVPPVVTWPVLHKSDQTPPRRFSAPREFIHNVTNCFDNVDIALFVPSPNVI